VLELELELEVSDVWLDDIFEEIDGCGWILTIDRFEHF